MKIALIGYGGVGKALVKLLHNRQSSLAKEGLDISLHYVVDIWGGIYSEKGIDLPLLGDYTDRKDPITEFEGFGSEITVDNIVADDSIDLVAIMTPTNKETGQPGLGYVERLLKAGKHVVISDKGPIMLAYHRLKEMADEAGVQLGIGCTTGGALPSVNGGLIDMAGSEILSIEGVLNGTTNFILKYMEDNGCEYPEALKIAQEWGIAETNPSLDVEGWDTAGKLLILTNVLMKENKTLADIQVNGITKITAKEIAEAREAGYKYKLVGKSNKTPDGVKLSVELQKVGEDSLLYSVEGKNKAVKFFSESLGDLMVIGGASGVTPAAASILRDIVNIHRGYHF